MKGKRRKQRTFIPELPPRPEKDEKAVEQRHFLRRQRQVLHPQYGDRWFYVVHNDEPRHGGRHEAVLEAREHVSKILEKELGPLAQKILHRDIERPAPVPRPEVFVPPEPFVMPRDPPHPPSIEVYKEPGWGRERQYRKQHVWYTPRNTWEPLKDAPLCFQLACPNCGHPNVRVVEGSLLKKFVTTLRTLRKPG